MSLLIVAALCVAGGVIVWLNSSRWEIAQSPQAQDDLSPQGEAAVSVSEQMFANVRARISDRSESVEVELQENPSDIVEDELIVTTRPGTTIEGIAQRFGAEVIGRLDGISTYRLRFKDAAARDAAKDALKTNPGVAEVQDNLRILLPPPPMVGGSADQLLAGKDLMPVDSDSPVVIGLIDSSVNLNDSELSGFLLKEMSVAEVQVVNNAETPTHGSAVFASILEGMKLGTNDSGESGVKILPVDVYGDAGETSTYQLAQGVVTAMEKGATIINMSLGSEGSGGTLMQDIVASGRELGVVFVGAAGNQPVTTPNYPAAIPNVLAVTSIDANGQIASYANRGSFIDVGLPGMVNFSYNEFLYTSQGTSMAAGVASGLAARLAEKNAITVTAAEALVKDSFKVGTVGDE